MRDTHRHRNELSTVVRFSIKIEAGNRELYTMNSVINLRSKCLCNGNAVKDHVKLD
jgi:hypothetical protein